MPKLAFSGEAYETLANIVANFIGWTVRVVLANKEYAKAYFDGNEDAVDIHIDNFGEVYNKIDGVTDDGIEYRVWPTEPHDGSKEVLSEPRSAPLSAFSEIYVY